MYNLKLKSARQFFSEVSKKYPAFPFSIAGFEDQTSAKVGVKESVNHELLIPYPVMLEKGGENIAQFKTTIAILPKSTTVLCGEIGFDEAQYNPDKKIEDAELTTLLSQGLYKKEKPTKEK